MTAGLGAMYLLREAGALISAGATAGSIWPGGTGAGGSPMPNLPWMFPTRNTPPPMRTPPVATDAFPGNLQRLDPFGAGALDDMGDGEAGDYASDLAAYQGQSAQRAADWASLHAGPPGTVVPPMPDSFEPLPPMPIPPTDMIPGAPGSGASPRGGGTYYNPPPATPPAPTSIVPIRSVRFNVPSTAIATPTPATPIGPAPAPPYVATLPPPRATEPTPTDTATPPTGGGGGGGGATNMTPLLLGGGIVLALLYFGRKKKRGR